MSNNLLENIVSLFGLLKKDEAKEEVDYGFEVKVFENDFTKKLYDSGLRAGGDLSYAKLKKILGEKDADLVFEEAIMETLDILFELNSQVEMGVAEGWRETVHKSFAKKSVSYEINSARNAMESLALGERLVVPEDILKNGDIEKEWLTFFKEMEEFSQGKREKITVTEHITGAIADSLNLLMAQTHNVGVPPAITRVEQEMFSQIAQEGHGRSGKRI